jgi:TM2 domain-containing membrane protein YozV
MNCAVHTDTPAAAFCRNCGKALCENCKRDVMGAIYCEPCIAARLQGGAPVAGQPVAAVPVVVPGAPSPGIALLLGFIPGVGAMYNGQFMKALVHVGIFVMLIAATDRFGIFGIMIAFWVWYMAFDAYKTAQARQLGLPLPDPLGIDRIFGLNESQSGVGVAAPGAAAHASVPPGSTASAGTGSVSPGSAAATPGTVTVYPVQGVPPQPAGGTPTAAVVLIALGALFLLGTSGWLRMDHTAPLFLIALGVWLAYKRSTQRR